MQKNLYLLLSMQLSVIYDYTEISSSLKLTLSLSAFKLKEMADF